MPVETLDRIGLFNKLLGLYIESRKCILCEIHGYNLHPSGSSARAEVIQQLFMPMQQRVKVCKGEMRKCEADALSRGITFELVNHDWVLSELYSTLDEIAGDTTFDMI